jgi:single-stranded-DNA-specific exonuclease
VEEELARRPELLEQRLLLFRGASWQAGIVGLAASKLADVHRRPVVVLSVEGGVAHGSARSIPGFDITSALAANSDLLIRHGGHERAAGLAIPEEQLDALETALLQAIASSPAPPPGPPAIAFDAELESERLRVDTAKLLQTLGPFGEGNPVPILRVNRAPLREYLTMGRERQHLKLRVGSTGPGVDALLWNGAARSRELLGAREVDLAGSLELNQWNGTQRAQMRLIDFRVPSG